MESEGGNVSRDKRLVAVRVRAALMAFVALPALAEAVEATPEAAAEAPAAAGAVGEIVVTAQRRAESMQRVPIAITAITAEQLSDSGVRTSEDIALLTPGLTMTRGRNSVLPYLRGIGTRTALPGMENAVATYIDGVYIASQAGSAFALADVERVEVLKGPQGTLFGRNATGGLLHAITKTPTQELTLDASVGFGNYDTTTASLYVAGGLRDNVAGSIALYANQQGDGWGTNFYRGNPVNRSREGGGRAKLVADFTDLTRATLSVDYSHIESDFGGSLQAVPGATLIGGVRLIGTIYDANTAIGDPFLGGGDTVGAALRIEHELSDRVSLSSLTAWRYYDIPNTVDTDGGPAVIADVMLAEKTTTLQQEFLMTGSATRLDWTLGLFYFYSDSGPKPFTSASTPGPNNFWQEGAIFTDSYAAFGQGTYQLTDGTRLTLGARYTYEEKETKAKRYAAAGNPAPLGSLVADTANLPESQRKRDWSKPTFRVALDHQLTDDVLAYVSWNRGFKSGSFASNNAFDPAVDPETLDAYEIGLKTELFDRRVRLNTSAYYYDYKNIQLIALTPLGPVIKNAASGRVQGLETELAYAPPVSRGRLQISASMSVMDSEYQDFPNATFFLPRPTNVPPFGGNVSFVADASGNDLIRAPRFSASLAFDYTVPLAADTDARLNLTWSHTGKFYWDPDNRMQEPANELVNAQVSYGASSAGWRVRVWGRNLLDREYYGSMNSSVFGDTGGPGAPRTFGVAVDFALGR